MEKETGVLGVQGKYWIVLGFVGAAIGLLVICAFVALMFGMDIGACVG
jgi:hypothetical protein